MKIFALTSMVLFTLCFIPQIILTYRSKNASGLSPVLWIMVVLGHLTGLIYMIHLRDMILIATYFIGLISSSMIVAGYYRYR
ncbi:lipid-A-disaccharide synthase N-terminal domain-containing protein [Candidatus Omnitrophota bacterium]